MAFLPPATPMGLPAQTPRKQPLSSSGSGASFADATPLKTPHRTPGGTRVDQTSSTPIIDISAIESQKENVQPLARGRSAHALSNALTMQHKQRQAALTSQRQEHEDIVTSPDNQDSDDPLEAWTKYVKWCIDNYPSGQTHESGLVPLLERATRTFKDSEQYNNDSRYLRLWILYARNVECARDIYNFLLANEIGTKLASLYEELAVVNEGQNMFEEADKIYKLGIARRANPLDRLKRRYAEYQQRILLHPQVTSLTSDAAPQNYSEALRVAMASCGRSVLGHKDGSAAGPTRSNSANVLRGAGARVGAIGSSGSSVVNNGRKLAVFQEDDEAGSNGRLKGPSSGGWDDVGTASSRSRENLHPDRMGSKSFTIGASGGLAKKPSSGLAVFRDSDDEEEDEDGAGPHASGTRERVLNPKDLFAKSESAKAPTETDLLRRNPLMYWEPGTKLTPDAADLHLPVAGHKKSSKNDAPKSHATAKDGERDKASVSSTDKARKSSKASSSSRSATGAASSSSGPRQERHACPISLLYPGIASLEDAAKSRAGDGNPTSEVCLEELLVAKRGLLGGTAEGDDPWAFLDEIEGQWLPRMPAEDDIDDSGYRIAEQSQSHLSSSEAVEAPPSDLAAERAAVEEAEVPTASEEPRKAAVDAEPTSTMPSRDVFDPDNSFNNAVALNMRPKKKKNGKDATMRTRMSPTLVTKATMREVESMFNGEDSESDSNDDEDSDDSSEEEDDVVAPLPPASLRKPKMLSLSSADVPPTPTPMGRNMVHGSTSEAARPTDENQRPLHLQDENAGVRATPVRPAVLGVKTPLGMATPMRTPLGTKKPGFGSASAAKPIYRDEDEDEEEDEHEQEQAVAPVKRPTNIFETPAPATRHTAARRAFEPMVEEDEDSETGSDASPDAAEQPGDADGSDNDQDDYQPNVDNFRPQFQPLTPITEATYEMTRFTTMSQNPRTPATASRPGSRMQVWERDEDEVECEAEDEEDADAEGQMLTPGELHNAVEEADFDEAGVHDREEAESAASVSQVGEDAFLQSQASDAADREETSDSTSALAGVGKPLLDRAKLFGHHEAHQLDASEDRSYLSSTNDQSTGTLGDRSNWGNKAQFELTEGLTIARDVDDETGQLRSYEQMGKSFVIEDRERTRIDSDTKPRGGEGEEEEVGDATGHSVALAASSPRQTSRMELAGFQPPNPCSPVDGEILAAILSRLSPPLHAHAQFVDLTSETAGGRLAGLQKRAKTEFRRSVGGSTYGNRASAKDWTLDVAGATFSILEKIGEGGYGAVFLAEDVDNFAPSTKKQLLEIEGAENLDSSFAASLADLSLSVDEEEAERRRMLAIKAESPPNPWEFYVLDRLRKTLEPRTLPSIVSSRKFISYSDESFLLLEYGEKGTLLEVVNQAAAAGVGTLGSSSAGGSSGGGVEEVLAMFFTIELLKVVESLHSHQVIHGDLKIDNCLLRLDEAPAGTTWSNAYMADGTAGWAQKGLTLIDFGRAIDMTLYPASQTFVADWTPDARDCAQMREARPFTYHTDYHGIASVAFCLLFGRYIETTNTVGEDGDKRWKIMGAMRRYWQVDLWNRLFETMLNPPMREGRPIVEEMKACREEMQLWLEANCNRGGKNLKGLIRKLEIWAMKRAS